ncbi:MAG: V-type ATPase subunit a family protein, partial [Nitrospira sp.]|nr:V-type ATPase subunit a family protein [Nitrospira sp.]
SGLKLGGFDKVTPEGFKGMKVQRLIARDKKKRLEIEINTKGIDPATGKLIEKTVINVVFFPK